MSKTIRSTTYSRAVEKALLHHMFPLPGEVKPRLAKEIRAMNKNRPTKVRKATVSNPCTLGGHLSNKHNDSGRRRIRMDEVMNDLISNDPEFSIY